MIELFAATLLAIAVFVIGLAAALRRTDRQSSESCAGCSKACGGQAMPAAGASNAKTEVCP
jgi:hypothetical protein